MPAQELAFRRQKALLWAAAGLDQHAQPLRALHSVELDVRWDGGSSQQVDPKGSVIGVDATVVIDRDIAIGSIMWEGSLVDLGDLLPGTGTSTLDIPPSNLMVVVTFNKTEDLKKRNQYREVGLKRLKDDLMPDAGS